jgi:hypothetical protein
MSQNAIVEAGNRLSIHLSDIVMERRWWNSYGALVAHTVWPGKIRPPYTILKPAYYTVFGDTYPWDWR